MAFDGSGETVPANLPGFWVSAGSYGEAGLARVSLVRTDAPETVALDAQYRLLSPMVPGATYEVTLGLGSVHSCAAREVHGRFIAGNVAPIPTSLGESKIVEQGRGTTAVGFTNASCYSSLQSVYADFEPSLEGDAAAWRAALVNVRAVVDGDAYWVSAEAQPQEEYFPTRGSGLRPATGGDLRVRVFVACQALQRGEASSYVRLAEGEHRVKLVGFLAGVGELETRETTVNLVCTPSADGGALGNAGTPGDAGRAAARPPPAQPFADSGMTEGERDEPSTTGGDGCRASQQTPSSWWCLLLLACASRWRRPARRR